MYGCAVMRPPCRRGSVAGRRGRGGSRRARRRARRRRCRRAVTAGRGRGACRRPATTSMFSRPMRRRTAGLSCWLPRPKRAPWPPTTPTISVAGSSAEQLEQLALAEVEPSEAAGAHRVDAEQRLRRARGAPRSAAGRRSRAEDVDPARIHRRRRRPADGVERGLVGGGGARSWRTASAAGRRGTRAAP